MEEAHRALGWITGKPGYVRHRNRAARDRTVPELMDEHVRSAILPLLDELLTAHVRRDMVTVLATADEEFPSGTALNGAISSAVADRLDTTFPAGAGVDTRAARLNCSGIYSNAR